MGAGVSAGGKRVVMMRLWGFNELDVGGGVEGDDGTRAWRSDDYIRPSRELRTISGCQSNPQHN